MSHDKLIADRDRGARANAILTDDLVVEAIRAIRDEALDQFKDADPTDLMALQEARLKYRAAEEFVGKLADHIETGRRASMDLEAAKKD